MICPGHTRPVTPQPRPPLVLWLDIDGTWVPTTQKTAS